MKYAIKYLAGLFMISNAVFSFGQDETSPPKMPIDETTKLINYTEVVQQTGTRDELYNRAISWINSYFKNPGDVTRVRDKENGKIECVHRIKVQHEEKGVQVDGGLVQYELYIDFKDGKYRYSVTKFNLKNLSYFPLERWLNKNDPSYNSYCPAYLHQVDDEIKNLIKSLKKGMEPPVVKNDNW